MLKEVEYIKKYLDKSLHKEALEKLKKGIPVQYIVGNVNFYGYTFKVNENVLIPRFETELLIEKTINYIKKYLNENIKIVDIGTGSGAIAITLKKELEKSLVTATDISSKALEVAIENARDNNVDINFIEGDLLSPLKEKYDVIISNPPYIAYDEEIEEIVKNNEPHLALYASDEGMYNYKQIIKNAKKYLNDKFIIAFEIGYMQGGKLKEYAKKYFSEEKIKIEKDYSEKDRFMFIIKG